MIILVISLLVGVLSLWFYVYYKHDKHLKTFSGPTPWPLLGNAFEFGSTADMLPKLIKLQAKYGNVKMCLGFAPPTIFVSEIKLVEYLLSSTKILEKSDDYKFLHRWLGRGLLTSYGEKWFKHRKILTPAFHFQILEQFIEVFDLYSDVMLQKMEKDVGKSSVDIYPYITLCSLDIICATAMGTKVNAQENAESEYVTNVKEMCRIIVERAVSPLKMHDIFYYFSKDYKKENAALKVLHNYTYSVIDSRRKQLLESLSDKTEVTEDDDVGLKKRRTFLDLLLQCTKDGQPLTNEKIREEVDTFMFEGHDTTASAMSFILYSLALNPEVQEKAMVEQREIFGEGKNRPLVLKDLQQMKYLEMVIKETLRLYPSVPMYSRNLHEDITYYDGVLPKDLTLAIFTYGIHRDPKIYPDPERFDPERFTLENQAARSPYAFTPFSAGPRNCIGQKFAMLEMKSIVSKVLRRYELFPSVPAHQLVGARNCVKVEHWNSYSIQRKKWIVIT